jgi:predicted ATPase/DNA-binding SARP family transcriptional activator/Tfp pilus assembly protein PilF
MEPFLNKPLSIRLLGKFSIVYNDEQILTVNTERLQSLLVYLLLHWQAPVARHKIAHHLWPDSSETQARTNLRNLLFTLRQALPTADTLLEISNLTLQWKPQVEYSLDVADFERLLAQAAEAEKIAAAGEERTLLEAAIDIYGGELLPGNYDDWILALREDLHQSYHDALERLVDLLEQAGNYRAALRYAQRLLQQDPLDEESYVHLMRLHALIGDRTGVRRVYESCVSVLMRELDADPCEETEAAYAEYVGMTVTHEPVPTPVGAAKPSPAVDLSPVQHSLPTPKHTPTLPMPSVPFVGREQELAQLAQLLAEPECRLLTILGPGGIGKTHLALQTAKGHQPVYTNGVAFVPLATLSATDQFVFAILNGLSFSASSATAPEQQLIDYLRPKNLLLVLDNLDHLLNKTDLLVKILEEAPEVKIMATSRERLNLQEEWVYTLHGLPVPQELDRDWQEKSSIVLFLQAARKVRSDFALTEDDRSDMVQLCRLLDGMPLGIQLAAAWVRMLSPAQIVQEIERSLEFLSVSHRNVPERHRSLRALFDYSWQNLSCAEQEEFCRLALFRGSFSREAAEEVAGSTLLSLTTLLDKSLVRQNTGGRYSMHDLLRQYAGHKLQERAETQQRHSHYYMHFLHKQAGRLYSGEQIAILDAIHDDLPNIQSAWQWASNQLHIENLELGLQTLSFFFFRRSRFQEAVQLLSSTIERLRAEEGAQAKRLLGRLLCRQGYFLHSLGRLADAVSHLEESLSLARLYEEEGKERALVLLSLGHALGDIGNSTRGESLLLEAIEQARLAGGAFAAAMASDYLGAHYLRLNLYTKAKVAVEESIALYRQLGDVWGLAHSLNNLANIARHPGEFVASIPLYQESLELYQTLGNQSGVALAFNNLGHAYMMLGEYEQALSHLDHGLQIQRRLGEPLQVARTLNNQGHVAYLLGRYDQARRLSTESLSLRRQAGAPLGEANSCYTLGLIEAGAGNMERAEQQWQTALAVYERTGYQAGAANSLNELAHVALSRRDYASASALLQRGQILCEGVETPLWDARRWMLEGMLASATLHVNLAVAHLYKALKIAFDAYETVLALDILLEISEILAQESLDPATEATLCLLLHHPQSHLPSRRRARQLLLDHQRDPDALPCNSYSRADLILFIRSLLESQSAMDPVQTSHYLAEWA